MNVERLQHRINVAGVAAIENSGGSVHPDKKARPLRRQEAFGYADQASNDRRQL